MSLCAILRETARPNGAWVFVLLPCAVLAGWSTPGFSQVVRDGQIGGLNSTLQIVPPRDPRPAEGPDADQQWQTSREKDGKSPVASFISSLQGNDAAFEVILGQGRLLTTKVDIAAGERTAVIAVGDPTVIDFQVLPNPRMIRIIGRRAGVTDLSITTADGQVYGFEVHVVYDLQLLRAHLKQIFPDTHLKLAQLREHLIVEGQARSPAQVNHILQAMEAYLESVQMQSAGAGGLSASPTQSNSAQSNSAQSGAAVAKPVPPGYANGNQSQAGGVMQAGAEIGGVAPGEGAYVKPRIINLLRVPGIHQVMLQVRIAELNRTGLREIGADIFGVDPDTGNIVGTQIGGASIGGLNERNAIAGPGGLAGFVTGALAGSSTVFGIFPSSNFAMFLRALRQNQLLSLLAEPNLMALSGQEASFLAGGQFPVPVPQAGGGVAGAITIEWKDFGVQLNFVPYVMDDESIRLQVAPEVSTIDDSLGVTVLGTTVPGVNTRKASTVVELRQGQTLAIAGLLQVTIAAQTSRIPVLGDLPYIGPMFSNTSHKRVEKELLVLVTPFLVRPMDACEVPCLPGDEIKDPNDLEFYLMNRIEGRTGRSFRSTTSWDDPCHLVELMELEERCVSGPVGFSE